MIGDELKNINNMLSYYEDKNDDLLNLFNNKAENYISELRTTIPNSNKCLCNMGHLDIRNYGACLECDNLYNISSFKEPCDDYVFEVQYGELKGKKMLIRCYHNSIIFPNTNNFLRNISNVCDNSTNKTKRYIENSDYFSNSSVCSIVIGKLLPNAVNKNYMNFLCRGKGFQLVTKAEYGTLDNLEPDKEILVNIIRQLIYNLKNLKKINFMHGDPIIENIYIFDDEFVTKKLTCGYCVKFDKLDYASLTYKNTRIYKKGPYNTSLDTTISTTHEYGDHSKEKFFTILDNLDTLINITRHSGSLVYPCVLDLYCFVISTMCKREFYDLLMDDDYFMENVYKKMFYETDWLKVRNKLRFDQEIKYRECLDILVDIKMKCNIFSILK